MKLGTLLSIILNIVLIFYVLKNSSDINSSIKMKVENNSECVTEKKSDTNDKPNLKFDPTNKNLNQSYSDQKENKLNQPTDFDDITFKDNLERIEADWQDFLIDTLGVQEETLVQHKNLRVNFQKKISEFFKDKKSFEPSLKERRQVLELEEEYHSNLEKIYGKEKWQKYLKFRDKYNREKIKKQMETGEPFYFMDL